mmetsp:Transcript_115802/g.374183  ORF Transcript_115802/g.374183 Transcript_115802/m.374183 type:complete len:210 (-) Transcript_115802:71-700(-)
MCQGWCPSPRHPWVPDRACPSKRRGSHPLGADSQRQPCLRSHRYLPHQRSLPKLLRRARGSPMRHCRWLQLRQYRWPMHHRWARRVNPWAPHLLARCCELRLRNRPRHPQCALSFRLPHDPQQVNSPQQSHQSLCRCRASHPLARAKDSLAHHCHMVHDPGRTHTQLLPHTHSHCWVLYQQQALYPLAQARGQPTPNCHLPCKPPWTAP